MILGGRHGGQKHARWALAALLVWGMGAEIGPSLHIGLHDQLAPHTHAGDAAPAARRPWLQASTPPRTSHGHRHGAQGHGDHAHAHGHTHSHARAHSHADEGSSTEERDERGRGLSAPRGGHGTHDLSHRHLAIQTAPVSTPRLVGPAVLRLDAPAACTARAPDGTSFSPHARGPPPAA